jgi:formate hydrogenlyase subunit 3/multisubunit Na+/H+ antiporter MnhD subunit
MDELLYIIWIPLVAGLLLAFLPDSLRKLTGFITIGVSALAFTFAIILFAGKGLSGHMTLGLIPELADRFPAINGFISRFGILNIDELARLLLLLITFFSFIITIYSISYTIPNHRIKGYYSWILITMTFSSLAVISDHLLFFIFCWGILGITLYKLIKGSDEEGAAAAKKTMILVGASDTIMLLGIAIVYQLSHSFEISGAPISTVGVVGAVGFFCLLIGSFTKAGAVPFHTWVPDFAKKAPASSTALLPASLDKLLGIYFMFRICTGLFTLTEWITLLLVAIGVLTIIIGVMMALVQHNMKQLLGYHAVSQVGYMVLGLGLGTPLGIAGGLFHMVNHTMYKSGLFLAAGNVEHRFGTDQIEHLGGSARYMPVTFLAAVIFALSISGVPPLNGFASKWLIYQAIIDFGSGSGIANQLWILWLGLAVLGSALTLASFIKFLSGVFLGRTIKPSNAGIAKTSMLIPVSILALICVVTGIFATPFVLPKIIQPLTDGFETAGIWQSGRVAILVLVSIVLGVLIYLTGSIKKFRTLDSFIGGERDQEVTKVSVLDFYKTISQAPLFSSMYNGASRRWFDLYDVGKGIVLFLSRKAGGAHTGILPFYIAWLVTGLIILLVIMMK